MSAHALIKSCKVSKTFLIDEWMTCHFIFSTVLQSYHVDGQMIMKGSVQGNHVYS